MKTGIKKLAALSLVALVGLTGLSVAFGPVTNALTRTLPLNTRYMALGDSIASGPGLPAGPTMDDVTCARSPQGYPNLIAASLKTTVTNLSCSGAKDSAGILRSQPQGNVIVPSQLDRAFSNGSPDLMTVTIGANDVNWVGFISKCYVGTCGTLGDTLASAGYLTYLQGKLAYTLHEIRDRSGAAAPPRVLISGYYNPISSTTCANSAITAKELTWINNQTENLNKAIRQTVTAANKLSAYTFVSYVPVNYTGHGLCSSDPWVQNISDPAPLHPTATGQAAIARSFLQYVR